MSSATRRHHVLSEALVDVHIKNQRAASRRTYTRADQWLIRHVSTHNWIAYPAAPGVHVSLFPPVPYLPFDSQKAALAEVLRRVYSK